MIENPYQSPRVDDELFDSTETRIIAQAEDLASTSRSILYSVLAPLGLIAMVLAVYWHTAQPPTLLWLFVGYIAATMLEKVRYGLAVLVRKRVIQKLVSRVEELEACLPRDLWSN